MMDPMMDNMMPGMMWGMGFVWLLVVIDRLDLGCRGTDQGPSHREQGATSALA